MSRYSRRVLLVRVPIRVVIEVMAPNITKTHQTYVTVPRNNGAGVELVPGSLLDII